MNDMSISPTPSRTARCSASHCANQRRGPRWARLRGRARAGEPVGALPAATPRAGSRPCATSRSCTGESLAPRAEYSCLPGVCAAYTVPRISVVRAARYVSLGLVRAEPVDVEAGDVDVGLAVDDPLRDDPAEAAGRQHADGVHAGGDEVAAGARRLADGRRQVGRERLRPAEERADADLQRHRHAGHRRLQERAHPVPVGLERGEREAGRDALEVPRGGARLEEADHHPAALLAVVAVRGGVLEDRRVRAEARRWCR